jgi:SAM-dependent methyltransferase/uncharacterized protein YbaR (Trm112 family)
MDLRGHSDAFDDIYVRLKREAGDIVFPLAQCDAMRRLVRSKDRSPYSYLYLRFSAHILACLELRDGLRILDVGSGEGYEEKNLRALCPDAELWGVDISAGMVRQATRNRAPGRLVVAAAEALPFPDNTFDRVVSREVIEHAADPAAMLAEIARVLYPGGVAVITTPNGDSLSRGVFFTNCVRPWLARLFGCPLPPLPYKDDKLSPVRMRSLVRLAGLELAARVWDGGAYFTLDELNQFIPFRMDRWAHFFSALENDPLAAPRFCDQVKYVLRKPAGDAPARVAEARLVCPACKGGLDPSDVEAWRCLACGRTFALDDGIPVLIPAARAAPPAAREETTDGGLRRFVFRLVNFALGRMYALGYLTMATLAALRSPRNGRRFSRQLLHPASETPADSRIRQVIEGHGFEA